MGLDKLFGRQSPKVEQEPTTPDEAMRSLLSDLDAQYGRDEVNTAVARLRYRPGADAKLELPNLSPASNALLKQIEQLGQKYPIQDLMGALAGLDDRFPEESLPQ